MSFDNDLKQAFERHAGDVSPTPGAWTGVETRIRRSHRVRGALAAAGGAAAIVAAVFAVPAVLRNETTSPPDGPVATQPGTVSDDKAVFRNERDKYWLQYPKDWRFGEFEAHVSFQPPGLPGLEEGGETFGVDIWVDAARYDDPERLGTYESTNPADQPRDTTIAGRKAKEKEYLQKDGAKTAHSVTYFVDWTGPYGCGDVPACQGDPWVLIVNIQSTSSEKPLWDTYGDAAKAILMSLQPNNASTMPANTAVSTRRGSVDAKVAYDQATATVVQFMDARIEGGGAESMLSSRAKDRYDSRTGGLSLYSPGPREQYAGYTIASRQPATDQKSQTSFTVRIDFIDAEGVGKPSRGSLTEHIVVDSTSLPEIVSAEREPPPGWTPPTAMP